MNNRLARKHLIYVLACSSFFAFIITCFQLYMDYRKDVGEIHDDLEVVVKSYIPSIISGRYNFDNDQVNLLLSGITRLRHMAYAEIVEQRSGDTIRTNVGGNPDAKQDIKSVYPLIYRKGNVHHNLGDLIVYANLDHVKARLSGRIWVLILSNTVKTFLMSLCILWIVQLLTVRRLSTIAQFTRALDMETIEQRILLDHVPGHGKKDEIDDIIDTINKMIERINEDMTRRKQLESHLQKAQKMESIGNLAGGIAHDMNNILTPIIGLSELLMDMADPSHETHESAQTIYGAATRGRELIRQILTFSRQRTPILEPVRLQPILEEVLHLSHLSATSPIHVTQDIQNQCGMVMADPSQLHQVFMNLLTNAYHAMETRDGRITLRLHQEDHPGNAPFNAEIQYPCAVVTITDTGCGMEPAVMDNIFDPYFTTKPQGKGTGLGLTVVYGIVKACDGDIQVTSAPGKGTTFTVLLPIAMQTDHPERP